MADAKKTWIEAVYPKSADRLPAYTTISDMAVDPVYMPDDLDAWSYERSLGHPGTYPFTRGAYPSMYRGKLWTMRQFAGFGTAEDTNERFKFLLSQGQTGLSTAFDMPTLMGYDADHSRALGEVGREGVAVSSLADMEALFADIPLDKVTTSMTVNCSASILLAMYFAMAERRGIGLERLGGTIQNDMLKEFIAQKEWISPPEPSVRIIVDMIEFCAQQAPRWHPVSISGYHIREAGSTAAQELAFTLADGIGYVQAAVQRGLDVDRFAPRLSFFFNLHSDFFEEIAKLRAARRMWATIMRERFGAKNQRSLQLRTHCQTAGCSLTAQQPLNNIVRVAIQALAGVLGGTQSLHTNSMDETLALPSEPAVLVALRTQQIIAEETGVTNIVDPLGGSYAVEALTDRLEREAFAYIKRIDELGGIVRAIELGYPQKEIAEAAYRYQQQLDRGDKVMVGVNKYQQEHEPPLELLHISQDVERKQAQRVRERKQARNSAAVRAALAAVKRAASEGNNLMPPIIDAVKHEVTVGEISDLFRSVFGVYRDPAWI
ncbi:MAG TPA: methylmalonyl-CoA mutase family protein [Candidatus Margulisiibacteriota bacterium]|nr:methylmalonyl-CoA mutase family protein [Candidatus Margulisiibacteriota bacterium]